MERSLDGRMRRNKIDLQELNNLAQIGCTQDEIAAVLGFSSSFIQSKIDSDPEVAATIERGYAELKGKLRRAQIDMALSGNPALLIWLGKQWLGQRDKQETTTTTQVNILVQTALTELNNIPKEQLLAARDMLRGINNIPEAEIIENEAGVAPCIKEGGVG